MVVDGEAGGGRADFQFVAREDPKTRPCAQEFTDIRIGSSITPLNRQPGV